MTHEVFLNIANAIALIILIVLQRRNDGVTEKTAIKVEEVKKVLDGPMLASLRLNVRLARKIFEGSKDAADQTTLDNAQRALDAHMDNLEMTKSQ